MIVSAALTAGIGTIAVLLVTAAVGVQIAAGAGPVRYADDATLMIGRMHFAARTAGSVKSAALAGHVICAA